MPQATQSYLEGTGEFQEQLAELSAASAKAGYLQKGSVLALHYHAMRTYYDFHQSKFRNGDVVLAGLSEELRSLRDKGYMAMAPLSALIAANDIIHYFEYCGDVNDPLGDDDLTMAKALEDLLDYVGLMASPIEDANEPLPEVRMAA